MMTSSAMRALMLAAVAACANGHGQMTQPFPREDSAGREMSHIQRQPVASLAGALFGYDVDRGFRCRELLAQSRQGKENTLVAGQTSQIRVQHEANHPGDCSAWISYDCVGVTGDCEPIYFFKVQDFPGCGTDGIVPPTDFFLDLDLPAELPPCDRCVLRWEWIALQQVVNTENYVTCADVVIQSTSGPVIPSPFIAINGIKHLPATADGYRKVYNGEGPGVAWLVGPPPATYTGCSGTEPGCVSSQGAVPPPTDAKPVTRSPVASPGSGGDSPSPDSSDCANLWGQCGGQNWSGATCCKGSATCVVGNPWYSQCLPASPSSPSPSPPSPSPASDEETCAGAWDKCGGRNHNGPTCCTSGHVCKKKNNRKHVCVPEAEADCAFKGGKCGGLGWDGPSCCMTGSFCKVKNERKSKCVKTKNDGV